jgi:hypothetical protein
MLRLLILFMFSQLANGYTDESINLLVRSVDTARIHRYCIEPTHLSNGRRVNISRFGWRTPFIASAVVDPCNISHLQQSLPSSLPANTMLILHEHNCRITRQVSNVQATFGRNLSLIIISERTNTRYTLTSTLSDTSVTIPTFILWKKDFQRMNDFYGNLSNTIELSVGYPPIMLKRFRPATLLMFVLVFVVLLVGNHWAADQFRRCKTEQHVNDASTLANSSSTVNQSDSSQIISKTDAVTSNESSDDLEPAIIPMTYCIVVFILLFAVTWLLLIYYFPNIMIYVLQSNSSFCRTFRKRDRCLSSSHVLHWRIFIVDLVFRSIN